MITKYAILNPLDGSYVFETDHNSAVEKLAEVALAFYKIQAHGTLCSYVKVADDGSETWYAEDGSRTISPAELEAAFKAQASSLRVYGEIPITVTGV
jgi:hypothetical protein